MNTNLNKLVKENLINVKKQKENVLLKERNVIKKRFNLLIENVEIKTDKQKEKVLKLGISEVVKLKKENFNEKLINEEFDNVFSFIGRGPWETIQEKFFRAILKALGMDETSFMADLITISLSNIKLSEATKLLDCDYISGLLAVNLGETLIKRLQRETGFESGFSDILRNSIIDVLRNSDIGKQMKTKIAGFICPTINKMSDKFNQAFGSNSPTTKTLPAG